MQSDLHKEINRLQNLRQNKNKPVSEIEKQAKINVWKKQLSIAERFTDKKEKKLSEKMVDNYLENYPFENFHQITLLGDLIYEEILLNRLRENINEISEKDGRYIPDKIIASLHSVEDRISALKERLGIIRQIEQKDELTALEEHKQKLKIYQEFNRNEFECVAEDSLILMSDWTTKKIQNIQVGDEIFGLEPNKYSWKLKKQKVLATFDKGKKEVIKLKAGLNELEVTPEHKILAEAGIKTNNRDFRYYEACQSWGRNVRLFNYIENLYNYYLGMLLGFIDSDGWKSSATYCNSYNYNIAQRNEHKAVTFLLDYLEIIYKKTLRHRKIPKKTILKTKKKHFICFDYRLSTKNNELIDNAYKDLLDNKDMSLGYLAGFLLGDGGLRHNNSWFLDQSKKVNNHKIQRIIEILKKYQIKHAFNELNYDCNIWDMNQISLGTCRIPMKCPESKKISTWDKNLSNIKPFYSLEKFRLKFVDIEKSKQVYDLTTETGNFIVNGFIVHNCEVPFICKKCGHETVEMYLLNRRCKNEDWELRKHPYFVGRWLYNAEIIQDVEDNKITKEMAARYLRTSPQYIEWCIENRHKIVEIPGISQEKIDEFVKKNPFLK